MSRLPRQPAAARRAVAQSNGRECSTMIIETMGTMKATVYITAEEADVLHIVRDAVGGLEIGGRDYAAAIILEAMQRKLGYDGIEYSISRMSLASRARLAAQGMPVHDLAYRMEVADACGRRPHKMRTSSESIRPRKTDYIDRYMQCLMKEPQESAEADYAIL